MKINPFSDLPRPLLLASSKRRRNLSIISLLGLKEAKSSRPSYSEIEKQQQTNIQTPFFLFKNNTETGFHSSSGWPRACSNPPVSGYQVLGYRCEPPPWHLRTFLSSRPVLPCVTHPCSPQFSSSSRCTFSPTVHPLPSTQPCCP